MRKIILSLLLSLSFIVPSNAVPLPAVQSSVMPTGAMVIGNPAAPVRVVEYLSYTCPHCARYVEDSHNDILRTLGPSRKVAFEFRNYVQNAPDLTAALLARCGGTSRFFANTKAIFARQAIWMADFQALAARQGAAMGKMPMVAQLKLIASNTDLQDIMIKQGSSVAQQQACLASPTAQQQVLAMTQGAAKMKIPATPYFMINGKPAGVNVWSALQPKIKAAAGLK
jgi:protein-disulfide isomerase